ncbi:mechanosensitive ion channel domain-containing protein [Sorangium sp. So ce1036]|uniref:mechanosensitive ion channel family protein n=1 Tax=Sorangium sp. So ce1036 TaxID=3133328 RepID=UPI003F0813F7
MKRSRSGMTMAALLALLVALLMVSTRAIAGPQDGLPPPPSDVDRSTPRRAMRLLIDASRDGRDDLAAYALDLSAIPRGAQAERGPELAAQLKFVLDQKLWIVWEELSDEPEGNPADGPGRDEIGRIPLADTAVPVLLNRAAGPGGAPIWVVSRSTLAAVPELHEAYGPGPIAEWLPPVLSRVRFLELAAWQWLGLVVALVASALGGLLLGGLASVVAGKLVRRTDVQWDDRLFDTIRAPVRALLMLALAGGLVRPLRLAAPAQEAIDTLLQTLLIAAAAWLATRLVRFVGDTVTERAAARVADAALVRGSQTRVAMLQRIASVVVGVVAVALVLLQFDVVRKVGVSLLASAGIAGVVVGFAAQKSISTLLAGLQLSFSQPVRIGDTVIVEGEWGWIEEITLTFVVVKVWDLRRLVVPITYFLEKPFQNWTKVSPELLGTVVVYADYTVPVDVMREEVTRLCEANKDWDGKVAGLVVVDATEHTIALRALVSSSDAGKLWDLRCAVREGLVQRLQSLDGGRYLPKARVALSEQGEARRAPGSSDVLASP